MNPEVAKVIMQFLERVQLSGSEVQAYTVCIQALAEVVNAPAQVESEG